jgi:hypothetical protein
MVPSASMPPTAVPGLTSVNDASTATGNPRATVSKEIGGEVKAAPVMPPEPPSPVSTVPVRVVSVERR